jgi:predicted N-formylglutamate amidohydrolase
MPSRQLVQCEAAEPHRRAFEVVRGSSKLLILCDHAANELPPEYGTLGLRSEDLNRHIAFDIGALRVALQLGRHLQATVIFARFSRLLIDPNRGEDDPTVIMQLSDGAIIPGNARLSEGERQKRLELFYRPYHSAIEAEISALLAQGVTPLILSIHSFTETWRGIPRKWPAAILWDKDPRLAVPLLMELRNRVTGEIGDNEPYSGDLRNDTLFRHATMRGLPHALIEIRQDLIRDEQGQQEWASLLTESLSHILADPANEQPLSRMDYYGSHTDIEVQKR